MSGLEVQVEVAVDFVLRMNMLHECMCVRIHKRIGKAPYIA